MMFFGHLSQGLRNLTVKMRFKSYPPSGETISTIYRLFYFLLMHSAIHVTYQKFHSADRL